MKSRLVSLTAVALTVALSGCAVVPAQGYPSGHPSGHPGGAPVQQVDPMSVVAPALVLGGLWIAGQWMLDGRGHRHYQPGHWRRR